MVLVFGGSFNPPTLAHEAIIKKLYITYKPKKIIIVPTGDFFSWKDNLVPYKDRYHMASLMIKDLDYAVLSDIEDTKEFLGSYHTLNQLKQSYDNLYFVVGADHIKSLDQWIDYKKLIRDYRFIIMTRNDYTLDEPYLKKLGVRYEVFNFSSPISSTTVREDLKKHLDFLNPLVKDYILKHNLYQEVK